MSSQNAVSVAETRAVDISIHKLAHVIEYALLYMCFVFAFFKNPWSKKKCLLYGLLFVLIYGISDEFHQSFNVTRSPRWYDVVVDCIGGGVGYVVSNKVLKKL